MPGGRRDFQLCFPRDQIDRGGECPIGAVVRNLGREINRHAQRDAQDVQEREKPMVPQVPENMPSEYAKILCSHFVVAFT
jgi:hypothetical protein